MAVTDCDTATSDERPPLAGPRRTRIDPPHAVVPDTLASGEEAAVERPLEAEIVNPFTTAAAGEAMLAVEEPTAEMIAAVTGENLEVRREQLQLQVSQLGGHLRDRLREVDRREATLNARASELESDLRAGRWAGVVERVDQVLLSETLKLSEAEVGEITNALQTMRKRRISRDPSVPAGMVAGA